MRTELSAVLLICLTACGGKDEGRPSGVVAPDAAIDVDPCERADGYQFQTLVDFDPITRPGDGSLDTDARCAPEIINCSFYFNYDYASSPENPSLSDNDAARNRGQDCLELAVGEDEFVFTEPRLAQGTPEGTVIPGGRCGEEQSGLNLVTQNVGMCYGADGRLGWGAAFDITFNNGLDGSEWDGVSFWVKKRSNAGQSAIIVQFVDPFTVGAPIDPEESLTPFCDASDQPVPDHEKCDSFGTAVTMTEEWTFVPARFSSLAQKGFGVVSTLGNLKTD
jgi:hypothetical protein